MNAGSVVLERYHLHERVGSGGMGVVWRATDQLLHQEVALKCVSFGALVDEHAQLTRDRTLREARLAAQLRGHPNVIAVYDVLLDDGDIWLVMEYLPSHSLQELIRAHQRLDPRLVAQIGRHIANALAAGHAQGIEHRDVKPGNVLIGTDGTVKLTDYGISHLAGDPHLTQSGIIGTPAYLAPEVAGNGESSPASDVFSLGSTLYAAVEGQPPFGTADNTLHLLNVIRIGRIRPPTCAGPLEPLLLRLLRVNPTDRPDAATTRDLLTELITRLTEPDRHKRPRSRPRQWPPRRRIAITIGAALSAASVMTVVSLLTHSAGVARPPAATDPASPAGIILVDGGFEQPQISSYELAFAIAGQSIGAWTVTQGNVDLIGPGYWSAATGTQSVDLGGLIDGTIEQTFSTLPGQTYVVQFALAGNPDGPPTVKTGRAVVNGQPIMDFSFDVTGKNRGNMGYRKMTFSFTSSGTRTTIAFASTSGSPSGPVIDDVSITPAVAR